MLGRTADGKISAAAGLAGGEAGPAILSRGFFVPQAPSVQTGARGIDGRLERTGTATPPNASTERTGHERNHAMQDTAEKP